MGDYLTIYLKVKINCIEDISYLVFGCCASIATSSMISILAKNKTLEEASRIHNYVKMKRTEEFYENSNTGK